MANTKFSVATAARQSDPTYVIDGTEAFGCSANAAGAVNHPGGVGMTLAEVRASNLINVGDYGAAGDGITIDTVAINDALNAAGDNGVVVFDGTKTYLIDGHLEPKTIPGGTVFKTGVRLIGNGCTLKRANQVSSATSTVITTDPAPSGTVITVADGTQFSEGMQVTVFNGADYDPTNHTVTVISGNDVTVVGAFTTAFPAGGTLVSSHKMISGYDSWDIGGFNIDGNRANQTIFARWENQNEIFAASARCSVHDNYIHDAPAEGIVTGGVDTGVRGNVLEYINGNGIHFTGPRASHILVQSNSVKFTNLGDDATIGHANGAIAFSNENTDIFIENNYIEGSALNAFGVMTGGVVRNVTISGNIARNCARVMSCEAGATTSIATQILGAGEMVSSGTTITITNTGIVAALGVEAGNTVEIIGADQQEYLGIFVLTVASVDTLEFEFRGSATSPATGTISVLAKDNNPFNLMFSNNQVSNCGEFSVRNLLGYDAELGPNNVNVIDNRFDLCQFTMKNVHRVRFVNNTWVNYFDLENSVAGNLVQINDCVDVKISDSFEGGYRGIQIAGPTCQNVQIINCSFRNQHYRGVEFQSTLPTGVNNGIMNCSFLIDSTANILATMRALVLDSGNYALNIMVDSGQVINAVVLQGDGGIADGIVVKGDYNGGQAMLIIGDNCFVSNTFTTKNVVQNGTGAVLVNNNLITL